MGTQSDQRGTCVFDTPHLTARHDPAVPTAVGHLNTPLVQLSRLFGDPGPTVLAKLDNLQITGSAKERSAEFLLNGALARGELCPGGTVVESTSGNLGVALARQCALHGINFVAVVDDKINTTTVRSLRAFGATIDAVTVPVGGNRLLARVHRVEQLTRMIDGAVSLNQYANRDNPAAHANTTLPEIVQAAGQAPTHLYVATSTTGTLLGCQQAIAAMALPTQVVAVDAQGSALFGGTPGERKLPGLGAGFATEHSLNARPAQVRRVSDAAMVKWCRAMARTEGILVGASTGAIAAAIHADLDWLGSDAVVAMLVHDSGVPYLDTVFDDDWVRREITDADHALCAPPSQTSPAVA
jgi:2,3-diaminopropionate biosynthesis protein SbnA